MIIVEKTSDVTPPEAETPHVRPQIDPRYRLGVMLTGVDGSTWDLYNGPVRLLSGATGFGNPKPEHRWKSSPAVDGATWGGSRTPERQLTLPVYVYSRSSFDWTGLDAAFFDAIDPAGECVLTVATPDGRSRNLHVRYDEGGDAQLDVDPMLIGYSTYALAFIAADPYWQGVPIVKQYLLGDLLPLFPGPPFNINPSNVLGAATVTNPGDVPTWPVWTVEGPFDGFKVGLGGSVVEYMGSVAAGESITIDMHPRMLTIRDSAGIDRWANATEVKFAEVPPGVDIPMSLSLTGANVSTLITLQFTPRHKRAW